MRAFVAAGLALLSTAGVGVAATPGPYHPRPHAIVTLADRDGVAVRQFEARVRLEGSRLHVSVNGLIGRRDNAGAHNAFLQVGVCTGGTVTDPICSPTTIRRVRVPLGVGGIKLSAFVPRPTGVVKAIQVALTPDGKVVRSPTEYARLDLPASAWVGSDANQRFGAQVAFGTSFDVRSLRVDVVGFSPSASATTIRLSARNETSVRKVITIDSAGKREVLAAPARALVTSSSHNHHRATGTSAAVDTLVQADKRRLAKAHLPRPRFS